MRKFRIAKNRDGDYIVQRLFKVLWVFPLWLEIAFKCLKIKDNYDYKKSFEERTFSNPEKAKAFLMRYHQADTAIVDSGLKSNVIPDLRFRHIDNDYSVEYMAFFNGYRLNFSSLLDASFYIHEKKREYADWEARKKAAKLEKKKKDYHYLEL